MKKVKRPSRSVRVRTFAARAKYVLPAISALLVLIVCLIPCVEFRNDDTAKIPQSILGNARQARESYTKVLGTDPSVYEEVDLALAKDLRAGVIVLHVVLWVMMIFSFLLMILAFRCWSFPVGSIAGDRARLWSRLVIPGRWAHFLLTLLPMIPAAYPYYVLNRFAEYYRVKPAATENSVAEYYEYSIVTHGINPLVFAAVLAAVNVALFLIAADWEKIYGVDLFTYYVREDD